MEGRKDLSEELLLTGDDAISLGALVAGCRFVSGYPITPATEVLERMAQILPKFNGVVVQAEDEISAILLAVGASWAGARAMTATSGPGQDLMTEGIGYAGCIEAPVVVAHLQRAGPSTGLPTKTEQSDLKHVVFASHGEFPKIVISPGTVEEAFYMTIEAFNLADKYQCPVIVLSEQYLAQNKFTVQRFDLNRVRIDRGKILSQDELDKLGKYLRYRFTEDGISPRAIPGMKGGIFLSTGNEHDEAGHTNEAPENRRAMMEKRLRKFELAKRELKALFPPKIFGDADSGIKIISFGSTHGAILEAMEQLKEKGIQAAYMQVRTIWPFQDDEVRDFVNDAEKLCIVEANATGQLADLVRRAVGPKDNIVNILKYEGKAFRPSEIASRIAEAMAA